MDDPSRKNVQSSMVRKVRKYKFFRFLFVKNLGLLVESKINIHTTTVRNMYCILSKGDILKVINTLNLRSKKCGYCILWKGDTFKGNRRLNLRSRNAIISIQTKPNHPFYFVTKKLTHKIYFHWSYLPLWMLHTSVTLCSSQFQKYTKFKKLFYSRLDLKYYRMSIKDGSFPRVEEILRNLCIPVWSSRFPLKCFGLKVILAQILDV